MSRREFTRATKRAALLRAEGRCEARGAIYGLERGRRCNADLAYGIQFDHIILDANSKDNSLENCSAVCPRCHAWKTARHDVPLAAKTQRQQDKHRGIKRSSRPFRGWRKFDGAPVWAKERR